MHTAAKSRSYRSPTRRENGDVATGNSTEKARFHRLKRSRNKLVHAIHFCIVNYSRTMTAVRSGSQQRQVIVSQ